MDKLECIKDYYLGTKAYYLFWRGKHCDNLEWSNFILEYKYLMAAQISCISNLMLGIKEELVANIGGFDYESRLFVKALEESASVIAVKEENGYKIGNYLFPDAASVVALVRNKLAHGKYKIDFEHSRVILFHKGVEMEISMYKLRNFIMRAFINMISDIKRPRYERNIICSKNQYNIKRKKRIVNLSELKGIIRSYRCADFILEPIKGEYVSKECISLLENFLSYYKFNPNAALESDLYVQLCNSLKLNDCKLSFNYKKLNNDNYENDIIDYFNKQLKSNDDLDYIQQVELIGYEFQRKINQRYNSFNPLAANIKNLILIDGIYRKGSIDENVLSSYIGDTLGKDMVFSYDEFGMTLICMFNSLFIYPYDDVYDIAGEYTVNRTGEFDFGDLDLSMVNPCKISINDTPLVEAKEKLDGLHNKQLNVIDKINEQNTNLANVVGRPKIEAIIKKNINDLKQMLANLIINYNVYEKEYLDIKSDYDNNVMHFRNKAIIEGIRNSIAHGHYDFITNGEFDDTIIWFKDIYEGEITFELKISFADFEKMINENGELLINFVDKKINLLNGNVLSKNKV